MNLIEILQSTDPRIEFFRKLRGNDPRIMDRGGVLVEGAKQVERLLQLGLPLQILFMEREFYQQFRSELEGRDLSAIECYVASREVMEEIIGYPLHNGVMALAARPAAV